MDSTSQSSGSLQDRVAIVTGASRGIGREIALHLASLGARIVVNYTSNLPQAESLAAQINSSSSSGANPRAIVVRADVSDPNLVKSLFDEAEKAFNSPVHILVNSAGVLDSKYSSIANISFEDFDYIFSVNARGAFLCCKEAANRLKRGGGGRIIMVTSSLVGSLRPGFGAYAASKAAVETMVKILAKELKGTGITANCIAPGPIATEMFFAGKTEEQVKQAIEQSPLCRLGETKDVAPVVGFLATDASEWVNGQILVNNAALANLKHSTMFFAGVNEQIVKMVSDECPMGRFGETKDVASIVNFLATDASEWINGQVILATGGLV
ncbi:NADPH-dependent aldehyde reductase-like protein, chloroplastic [Senna tora]|uniref:NADPH-dependent aldehyde reductase-like protein, chloroplastic n=1 Tax=Senna tora TaxID=362788 RepID=A0A834TDE2_9FABA|nr:NADPH-dependent aldehyde reductase-like protein, chloroplastic [Senna tora]